MDQQLKRNRPTVLKHDLGPIDMVTCRTGEVGLGLPSTWCNDQMMQHLFDQVFHAYKTKAHGIDSLISEEMNRNLPSPEVLGLTARCALLVKHKFLENSSKTSKDQVDKIWKELWKHDKISHYFDGKDGSTNRCEALQDIGKTQNQLLEKTQNQLLELIQTKKSNGITLKWTIMDCLPGTKFKLHAHPNIELVYCLQGELHEIRMDGPPVQNIFCRNQDGKTIGPDLSNCSRSWHFDTLPHGKWLVNEVGSVHQSFTSSKKGAILIALWSSHADIDDGKEPKGLHLGDIIDSVDKKCCYENENSSSLIGETFLPASERRIFS